MVLQSGKKKSDFRINISRKEKKIMKMKRMAAAMLAAMMTVSLAACGQSGDNPDQREPPLPAHRELPPADYR